ncbi:MAG: hypothetical protein J6V07_05980, partial [Clostridia bacterium]|nr:hypothetical protein [Clostridia bacterium]
MLKYQELINKLTDAQKIRILTGAGKLTGKDMKVLGLKSAIVGNMKDFKRERYPSITALAHSFDRGLLYGVAEERLIEMQRAGVSLFVVQGPKTKLCPFRREISEDPFLAAAISAECVRPVAERGLVAALSGYYLTSSDADWLDEEPNEQILRDFVEKPYRNVISAGGAAVVTETRVPTEAYRNACRHLQEEIAEDTRFLVCERASGSNTVDLISRGVVCLEASSNALDSAFTNYKRLKNEIETGEGANPEVLNEALANNTAITEEAINATLDKTLDLIFSCAAVPKPPTEVKDREGLPMAATLASAVLLKNEGALPLDDSKKIALIGDILHGEEGEPPLESCRFRLAMRGYTCVGTARGYDMTSIHDEQHFGEALALCQKADTVVLFLGFGYETERRIPKTESLTLPPNQLLL